jgi:hypothetical protein
MTPGRTSGCIQASPPQVMTADVAGIGPWLPPRSCELRSSSACGQPAGHMLQPVTLSPAPDMIDEQCAHPQGCTRCESVSVQAPDKARVIRGNIGTATQLLNAFSIYLTDVQITILVNVEPVRPPCAAWRDSPLTPR